MRRQMEEAGEKWNIVIVKATIDHDASGIMETLLGMNVSLTLYHISLRLHEFIVTHREIGISGVVWQGHRQ